MIFGQRRRLRSRALRTTSREVLRPAHDIVSRAGSTTSLRGAILALALPAPAAAASAGVDDLPARSRAFTEASDAGTGIIGGHPCQRISGVARSVYRVTGRMTNVRRTTVWLDSATLLVRRIAEDASEGRIVNRRTTTFEPVVNPALDDGVFRFTPPE